MNRRVNGVTKAVCDSLKPDIERELVAMNLANVNVHEVKSVENYKTGKIPEELNGILLVSYSKLTAKRREKIVEWLGGNLYNNFIHNTDSNNYLPATR